MKRTTITGTGTLLAGLLLLAPTALASSGGTPTFVDDFEGGTNLGGWSYNPADVIEATGGAPGGWWHQASADTFGPIITSTSPLVVGDFRAKGVKKFSLDARVDGMTFPASGGGFNLSILLRDTKGTPDVSDDDYAYSVGAAIPVVGSGWKHYQFAVPSDDTSAAPAGWTGGWVGDCCSFRPGVDWNDVITSVDQVEIHFLDPSLFAIFQQWNIGLDNIRIGPGGEALFRNGSGVNPASYVSTSAPDLGTTWNATVDVVTPGHPLSFVAVSSGGELSGVFPGGGILGELLIQPTFLSVDVAAGAHAFPLPPNPSLAGICLATQGGTVAGDGTIHLANALDVVLGA